MIKKGKKAPCFKINSREIVDLTRELVRKETVNPPGKEYLTKDIVLKSLERLGAG